MSDEALVADLNELANHRVRLHASAVANHHALLNFDERPNKAIIAYGTLVKIDRFDHPDARSKPDITDLRLQESRLTMST